MQNHKKVEKRGSWNGFDSTPGVICRPPNSDEQPTAEIRRGYSLKERNNGEKTVSETEPGMDKMKASFDAGQQCSSSQVRIHAGEGATSLAACTQHLSTTTTYHGHSKQNQDALHRVQLMKDSNSESCPMDSTGLDGTSSSSTLDTANQTMISSIRLHAMETQLAELQQQLQHLKHTQINMGVASSPPPHKKDHDLSLENMTRQLNIARGEKHDMRSKIGELERDLAYCHQKSRKETLTRERLEAELRRLADMISSPPNDEVDGPLRHTTVSKGSEALTENDVSALKEQLKIFEEDFTNERSDSERLRVQNMRLMKELEEAKRVIEEQQRQLLLYAHLASSEGAATSVVLTPINDCLAERRSRSVPSTPNSSPHSTSFTNRYAYYPKETSLCYDGVVKSADALRKFNPEMRSMSDVVPRGINRSCSQFRSGNSSACYTTARIPPGDACSTKPANTSRP